jgi:exopolyphosphatase / guanosine-5'-triphosphate,3'-diphosphate pyrophosphatase
VSVRGRRVDALGSWPLGAVHVTERMLGGDGPVAGKELKRARAALRAELAGAPWLGRTGPRLVGVGSAARNLAAATQRAQGLERLGIQGHVLAAAEIRGLASGGRDALRRPVRSCALRRAIALRRALAANRRCD